MNSSVALSSIELHRTFTAIERHGGGFGERLAWAWFVADRENKARIEAAFPHLIAQFGPTSSYYNK